MLSSRNRLTSPFDFREVVRRGRRSGGPVVVVHRLALAETCVHDEECPQPRVGFVVSKAVGAAVVRNRVKRRLRHLVRERAGWFPAHDMLVVRALPAAAVASFDELAQELDRCLARVDVDVMTARHHAVKTEVSR